MRHRTQADYCEMPWANGRGVTEELWREDGPAGLALRLSMATVSEDGPFSALPGIDRVLVLIEGPGFALDIDGVRWPVAPLAPIRFAGEAAVAAVAVAGVSRDFNVMTARGGPEPEVRVLRPGEVISAARVFCFAVAAAEVLAERRPWHLGPRDLLETAGELRLAAGGPIVAVGLG